jgi:hypothetical protein
MENGQQASSGFIRGVHPRPGRLSVLYRHISARFFLAKASMPAKNQAETSPT